MCVCVLLIIMTRKASYPPSESVPRGWPFPIRCFNGRICLARANGFPRPDSAGGSGLLQQRGGPPCPAGQSLSAPLHPAGPAGAPQCSPMLSHVPPMPTPLMSRVCDMRERCASQFLTPSVSSPSHPLACLACPCTYRGRPCPWLPTPCRTRSGTAHCCSRWRTSTQVHPLSECPHSSSSFSFFLPRWSYYFHM